MYTFPTLNKAQKNGQKVFASWNFGARKDEYFWLVDQDGINEQTRNFK